MGILYRISESSYLPDIIDPKKLQNANGFLRTSSNISGIVSTAAAGVVIILIGAAKGLLITAPEFLVSGILLINLQVVAPEPQIKDEMITWEEFVKMFFEGRTHTLYGQIFNMFLAIFLIVLSFDTGNVLLFVVSLLILIVAVGSAVDITAHLWYH